jgi:hypothetical protein
MTPKVKAGMANPIIGMAMNIWEMMEKRILGIKGKIHARLPFTVGPTLSQEIF